jgi:hypothetical protein
VRAGEAAADDMDRLDGHGRNLGVGQSHGNGCKNENARDERGRFSSESGNT